MKVELNFNEEEVIQKLAEQELGQYSLTSNVIQEIKRQSVENTVKSIKEKLIDIDWYGKEKDYFKDTIKKEVYSAIELKITNLINSKFSEKSIEYMVNNRIDKIFNEFIDSKVAEKLEQAKADLQFYSMREQREIDEAEKESIKAELDSAYQGGLEDGYKHKGI